MLPDGGVGACAADGECGGAGGGGGDGQGAGGEGGRGAGHPSTLDLPAHAPAHLIFYVPEACILYCIMVLLIS